LPNSIPPGLKSEHVLKALANMGAGAGRGLGTPTRYVLVHPGKPCPPKAVVGLAFRHLRGHILAPSEFSGGEALAPPCYEIRFSSLTFSFYPL
jgi:hypothetical protein